MIRLLIAGGVGFLVSLVGTRSMSRLLVWLGISQPISEDAPDMHQAKGGTPTMGGVAIVLGVILGYIFSNFYNGIYTRTGLFVVLAITAASGVGLLDDWLKVSRARNVGLNKTTKILGLLVVAIGFTFLMIQYTGVNTNLSFTRLDSIGLDLGSWGWSIWAIILILAASNSVNLTDGLDGLAAGASIFGFAAFTIIAFWAFRNEDVYGIPHALDLAVIATAMMGACIGFLWWNAAPAKIFMGDTGSLAIGTAFACLSLATNTHLLLPIIGGLFVAETISVIMQVVSFRVFRKRIFRMSPFHHHFELVGWEETWVIIRLWIVAGLCTAVGLGIFYADFVRLEG